jgi:hypothetical protein
MLEFLIDNIYLSSSNDKSQIFGYMKFLRIKIILFFQYPLLIDWVSG